MNRVVGIVKTHLADRWSWLAMPWVILGISFACNYIIGGASDEKIYTGGLASIYIYMMVLGILSVGQTFPFIMGFSGRRKDYFIGTTATIGLLAAITSILLCVIGYIERLTDQWGVGLYFFNVKYLTDGPAFQQFWVLFTLMVNLFFMGFAISCIHRRFGRNGMYIFFIVTGLAFTVSSYLIGLNDKWKALFDWFADISVLELANGLFALTVLYLLLSYLLLRKATV
ncbi:hypothetical protein [Cohnella herbarum]|uniref:Uncharacterized protein n=1 Tax=Cohnella herbarum TaxID=2728023 RepID=A0A7Z2VR09_9BACL|nr:hypothetical protein [Cohnella herbarum]QJD87497.1 hypothetical protein HH215_32840 [Cohnella herbarum]